MGESPATVTQAASSKGKRMGPLTTQKLKAFGVHLSISLLIFAVLLYLIVFHWYPQPFFAADGGWQGIRIVFGVDMVLGPLMTFIVFRKGKPGLKLDLGIIALIQLSALSWGVYATYSQRPVLITFSLYRFYTVTADQFAKTGLGLADLDKYRQGSVLPMVYVDVPSDPSKRSTLFAQSMRTGRQVFLMSKLYRPINAQTMADIRAKAIDARAALRSKPRVWRALQTFLIEHHAPLDRYIYLPLTCRYKQLIAIVDPKTIDIVGAITLPQLLIFPQLLHPGRFRLVPAPAARGKTSGKGKPANH